jgi:hypothetical protein
MLTVEWNDEVEFLTELELEVAPTGLYLPPKFVRLVSLGQWAGAVPIRQIWVECGAVVRNELWLCRIPCGEAMQGESDAKAYKEAEAVKRRLTEGAKKIGLAVRAGRYSPPPCTRREGR